MPRRIKNFHPAVSTDLQDSKTTPKFFEHDKMACITEMAVTVNHEVNSPLMVILGEVQLLLRDTNHDKTLTAKLKIIETSAQRIQSFTARLLRINRHESIEYNNGIRMIDISDENQKKE